MSRRALLLVALALPLSAAADGDRAQWGGGVARNMISPETGLPAEFDPGRRGPRGGLEPLPLRNVRWVARLGSRTFASPTIAGGRVLVGTNDAFWRDDRVRADRGGLICCYDERTGKLLWRLRCPRYRGRVHGSGFDDMNTGVCSVAAVAGKHAYVVTNRAEVLCLDVRGQADGNDGPFTDEGRYIYRSDDRSVPLKPGDGDIVWGFDMIDDVPSAPHDVTACNVLLDGDLLYVGTSAGVHRIPGEPTPLPNAASLIVLHRRTGKLVAVDDLKLPGRAWHGQWSSPSIVKAGKRRLVLLGGGDGWLYALEALDPRCPEPPRKPRTLEFVWRYDCNGPEYRLRDGRTIDYWKGDASRNHCGRDWIGPSEIIATPVVADGKVYVAIGRDPVHGVAPGALHCIDPAGTGDISSSGRLWCYRGLSRTMASAAVGGGRVYIPDLAGVVHCLDAETGKPVWTFKTGQEIWASSMLADGKLYVPTRRRTLWVLRAGRKRETLAKLRLPDRASCTPIAANGTLYLAASRWLYAIARTPETPEPAAE